MINTDKYYWHGYLDEYERQVFSNLGPKINIMEFGVLESESIRFLANRFESAMVVGVDIIPQQPNWFTSPRVRYLQADQSKGSSLEELFTSIGFYKFDLIIDDGSHEPHDQALCLVKSFPALKKSGYYILEDAHTSYAQRDKKVNSFHLLLTLQHLRVSNLGLTDDIVESLTTNSFFNLDELVYLYCNIKSVYLFKRTALPLLCYQCKKNEFDYAKLTCKHCHVPLYQDADSMSFIIKKV